MMMNLEELKASGMLLDAGVRVPLRPLRLFGWRVRRSVTMWMPYPLTLVLIGRLYRSIGVTYEEMERFTFEQNMDFIVRHTKAVSRIIAAALVRDYTLYRIIGRPVAWWIRHRMEHTYQAEAMFQLLSLMSVQSFMNIIRSAETVNPMTPHLSHGGKRS